MPIYADPDADIGERLEERGAPLSRFLSTAITETASTMFPVLGGHEAIRRGVEFTSPSRMIPVNVANRVAREVGLPEFDQPVHEDGLIALVTQRKRSDMRNRIMASGDPGLGRIAAQYATQFIVSMLDPVAIGASVIPFAGPASKVFRLGTAIEHMSPWARTLGRGAFEGVTGNLMFEPANYYFMSREGREYTLIDSFTNLMVGGVLGMGIHATGKAFNDLRARGIELRTETIDTLSGPIVITTAADNRPLAMPEQIELVGMENHSRILQAVDAELANGAMPRVAGEVLASIHHDATLRPVVNAPEMQRIGLEASSRIERPATPEGVRSSVEADTLIAERKPVDLDDPDGILQDAADQEEMLKRQTDKSIAETDSASTEQAAALREVEIASEQVRATADLERAVDDYIRCAGGPQ